MTHFSFATTHSVSKTGGAEKIPVRSGAPKLKKQFLLTKKIGAPTYPGFSPRQSLSVDVALVSSNPIKYISSAWHLLHHIMARPGSSPLMPYLSWECPSRACPKMLQMDSLLDTSRTWPGHGLDMAWTSHQWLVIISGHGHHMAGQMMGSTYALFKQHQNILV